ncbi:MAG: SIR2 family protein [Kistimonas sp.]|nr:SIR2 family protein [Kistimonas sp.]
MNNGANEFSEYKIQIGTDDLIKKKILPLTPEGLDREDVGSSKADKKLLEVLKETRVRMGTLLKTDNVAFLLGAGASIAAGGVSLANIPKPLEDALLAAAKSEKTETGVPEWIHCFYETASLISGKSYCFDDRQKKYPLANKTEAKAICINLEDYLSHLHMWRSGIGIFADAITISRTGADALILKKGNLEALIRKITGCLTDLINLPAAGYEAKVDAHRKFIKKILTRPLNLRRANLFTLNYDTLIEQGADAEGAVLVDGFVGNLKRIFRPESYDLDFYFPAQTTEGRVHRFDRALHLYKLHGSITWHRTDQGWENPYGLYATFFNQQCEDDDVLIYPSPLKYGQALGLPYSELFRRFGNAVIQPQSVLFTIGYGFGDEHVNAIIRQALTIPSFTLIIVDPSPSSDFFKELQEIDDERVWIISGWNLGTFEQFVKKLLPDLREEEINAKVMKTFKALALTEVQPEIDDDE